MERIEEAIRTMMINDAAGSAIIGAIIDDPESVGMHLEFEDPDPCLRLADYGAAVLSTYGLGGSVDARAVIERYAEIKLEKAGSDQA